MTMTSKYLLTSVLCIWVILLIGYYSFNIQFKSATYRKTPLIPVKEATEKAPRERTEDTSTRIMNETSTRSNSHQRIQKISTPEPQRKTTKAIIKTFTNKRGHHRVLDPPDKPYLFFAWMQRLGNNIFQYTSSYCMALSTNHIPTISTMNPLSSIFSNITAVTVDSDKLYMDDVPMFAEAGWGMYDQRLVQNVNSTKSAVTIAGFVQSFKYIEKCDRDIRQQLVLKDSINNKVHSIMLDLVLKHYNKTSQGNTIPGTNKQSIPGTNKHSSMVKHILQKRYLPSGITYIGVHVRRRDISIRAPKAYFKEAFSYFRKRHNSKVLFLVCSDDIEWCDLNMFHETDVILVSDKTIEYQVDFGILVNCNSTIITGGTFSWWAAWLAGGETVYFDGFARRETHFDGERYHKDDYYPAHWKGMG